MVLLTRRDVISSRIQRNKILATLSTAIVFLIVPILILIVDPIHIIVKYKLRLAKGTILYDLLQQEIPAAYLSVYIFNITNADRFLTGEDYKLKVEEVGPFVFLENRWYEDLEISEDGTRLGMTPKIRPEFIPEASVGELKDFNLTLPNLPFLSAVAVMANYPSFVRYAFNVMAAQLGAKAIMNLNAHDYLWGYQNSLVTLCNNLAPGLVYFDNFGLLDRLYDNVSDFRIVVGTTDQDRFNIKSVKKFRHMQTETITDVDESELIFEDTYEGAGYPPMLTPDVPLNLYRLGICKTFKLEYIGSKIMDYGGEALVYTIGNKTFIGNVDPISSQTYPDGLMDISKCYYGLPFVVSKAYLMDVDPKVLNRLEGLKPNNSVNVNEIVVDRKVSVTIDTKMSLQLSMMVNDLSFNSRTRMMSHSVIPIVHIKVDQPKMPERIMSKFVLVYQTAPFIVMCIVTVLFLIGLAFLGLAVRLVHLKWVSRTTGIIFENTANKELFKTKLPLIVR